VPIIEHAEVEHVTVRAAVVWVTGRWTGCWRQSNQVVRFVAHVVRLHGSACPVSSH
jgi:hypothetical protein